MTNKKKRQALLSFLLAILMIAFSVSIGATESVPVEISQGDQGGMSFPCKSVLLMEAETGKILFEQKSKMRVY